MQKKVKDPVCGMTFAPDPKLSLEHDGKTYYFCSEHCKKEFSANYNKYLSKKSTPKKHDTKVSSANEYTVLLFTA